MLNPIVVPIRSGPEIGPGLNHFRDNRNSILPQSGKALVQKNSVLEVKRVRLEQSTEMSSYGIVKGIIEVVGGKIIYRLPPLPPTSKT